MRSAIPRETVLPPNDRSFWKAGDHPTGGLHYLAWGQRSFGREPIPMRRHAGWVFTMIESGNPILLRESTKDILRPGDVFVAGSDVAFGWTARAPDRCKFYMWMWDGPVTGFFPREDTSFFLRLRVRPAACRELSELHALCQKEVQRADASSESILRGCQLMLEGLIGRSRGGTVPGESRAVKAELAVRWLRNHLNSREPAARLGDYLGISGSTLHRLFKRHWGESPVAMAQKLKMETARAWLEADECSIKEIAFRLGYRQFSDFSRAFKTKYRCSPSAFRSKKRAITPEKKK